MLVLWIRVLPLTRHKSTYQAHERIAHHSAILRQIRLLNRRHAIKIDKVAVALHALRQRLLHALLHALLHSLLYSLWHALRDALRQALRQALRHILWIG